MLNIVTYGYGPPSVGIVRGDLFVLFSCLSLDVILSISMYLSGFSNSECKLSGFEVEEPNLDSARS